MKAVPLLVAVLLALAFTTCSPAQSQPGSAHVNLYFPHFADGGAAAQKWQTTFTFVNVGLSSATVVLRLYNDNGGPPAIDFGSGPSSTQTFTVPSNGVRILRSRAASSTVVVGWASGDSTVPVQATVAFRMIVNGAPLQEITAEPSLPTIVYTSAANKFLGIALANPYVNVPVNVLLRVFDANGNLLGGPVSTTVPASGHSAFNLWQKFPSLQNVDFSGVLYIEAAEPQPQNDFVAWTLNGDASGTLSALPSGATAWPISHWERIRDVYSQVLASARWLDPTFASPVTLHILYNNVVNAYASGGKDVFVEIGLSELISDSPSELAFAIAHELGHIYQQRNGGQLTFNQNTEFDADGWGFLISLIAGYDPYAGAGTLAKLAMATGTAGLTAQFENQLAVDAHKSFNERLASVFDTMKTLCAISSFAPFCSEYKAIVHPHLPPSAPLVHDWGRAKVGQQ